jgi:hypothetical protein
MSAARGLLAYLDPANRAEIDQILTEHKSQRDYAASRLSALYFCTMESARRWLDMNDQEAIEQAQRIMKSEPYTDIEVQGSYH